MTLTEEQREAIRAVSDLPRAIGCTQCHSYIQEHYGNQFAILRAMIDSSEQFGKPTELIGGIDLEKGRATLEEAIERMRMTVCDEDGFVWEADPEQTAILQEMLDRIGRYTNNDYLDLQYQLDSAEAEIERLRAEMDNYGDDFVCQMKSKDARIKELESSLDEAEALTKKNAELMNSYLTRIAELEDALVEGLTNFLHYRASCYDPARRCPYAKECDDCSTWDACGHVEKFRSEARQRLQADGKIGPDAMPRSWQITEERRGAIDRAMRFLGWAEHAGKTRDVHVATDVSVLRAMLEEDTHDKP